MVHINHVMSTKQNSKIFSDIISYFIKFASSEDVHHTVSTKPAIGPYIRHYHRPHFETELIKPCIVTVHHDLRDSDYSCRFDLFEARYREANVVVCLNYDQKSFLADYGIENTTVIPHGYNDEFLKLTKRHYDGKRPISLGIFSKRYGRKVKGEAYLYELVKQLDPDRFTFKLIGDSRSIDARYLRQRGFKVSSHEYLPYPVFCDAYQSIDILLITSLFEGGPASLPEAVATGTPIFASPVGMVADFVKDNRNGRILSMNHLQDAKIFNALADDDGAHLNSLFEGAALLVDSVCPWSKTVFKYEKIYESILQPARIKVF